MNTQEWTIRVVVLGGGYAGVIATNRFLGSLTEDERSCVRLTMVNPRAEFVERIRLHQLVASSRECVTIPLAEMLHPDAELVIGTVTRIDHRARTVQMTGGEHELGYDYLVYAVGSRAAAAVPGAREHAFLLADYDGARGAAAAITACGTDAKIAIVGGGLTAVEMAAELAEQRPDTTITLYCASALLATMRPSARQSIQKALRRDRVRIVENMPVLEVVADAVRLGNGELDPFDVCLVAASFDVPELAKVSGLPVDEHGRLEVDESLRCRSDVRIIGAGDATMAPDRVARHLRMSCASALPLGAQAAATVLASIRGTQPPALSVGYIAQCIGLGSKAGYIQLVRSDDTPRPLHIGGRAGAAIRRSICRLAVEAPVRERSRPGSYRWPKGPKPSAAA